MDMSLPEEDEQLDEGGEDSEVEKVLYALGKEAITNGRASPTMNGNGHGDSQPTKKPKPDLEIPRKVLHASIGLFSLLIVLSVAYPFYFVRFLHPVPIRFGRRCQDHCSCSLDGFGHYCPSRSSTFQVQGLRSNIRKSTRFFDAGERTGA